MSAKIIPLRADCLAPPYPGCPMAHCPNYDPDAEEAPCRFEGAHRFTFEEHVRCCPSTAQRVQPLHERLTSDTDLLLVADLDALFDTITISAYSEQKYRVWRQVHAGFLLALRRLPEAKDEVLELWGLDPFEWSAQDAARFWHLVYVLDYQETLERESLRVFREVEEREGAAPRVG